MQSSDLHPPLRDTTTSWTSAQGMSDSSLYGALGGMDPGQELFELANMSSLSPMSMSLHMHRTQHQNEDITLSDWDVSASQDSMLGDPASQVSDAFSLSVVPVFTDPNVIMSLTPEEPKYLVPAVLDPEADSLNPAMHLSRSIPLEDALVEPHLQNNITHMIPLNGSTQMEEHSLSQQAQSAYSAASSSPLVASGSHHESAASFNSFFNHPNLSSEAISAHPGTGRHSASRSPPSLPPTKGAYSDIATSGMIPTATGQAVPVGAVIDSLLESVIKSASSARQAYRRGERDEVNQQLEEMIASLRVVGGLGVGPRIGTLANNRDDIEMDGVQSGPSGRNTIPIGVVGLGSAAPRSVIKSEHLHAMSSGSLPLSQHQLRSNPPVSHSRAHGGHSGNSSLSPHQNSAQTLLLPAPTLNGSLASSVSPALSGTGSLVEPSSTENVISTVSPSPPATALSAVAVGMASSELLPNNMAMAQIPGAPGSSAPHSDPARKRTTASSLSQVEECPTARANKVLKLSPAPTKIEEGQSFSDTLGVLGSNGSFLSGGSSTSSYGSTPSPSASTKNVSPPSSNARLIANSVSPPTVVDRQLGLPSESFKPTTFDSLKNTSISASYPAPPITTAMQRSTSLTMQPTGPGTVTSSALLNGWTNETPAASRTMNSAAAPMGVIIPPPHSSLAERRLSMDSHFQSFAQYSATISSTRAPDALNASRQGALQPTAPNLLSHNPQLNDQNGPFGMQNITRPGRSSSFSGTWPVSGLMDLDGGPSFFKSSPSQKPIDLDNGGPLELANQTAAPPARTRISPPRAPGNSHNVGAASTFTGAAPSRPPSPSGSEGGDYADKDREYDSDSGDDADHNAGQISPSRRSSFNHSAAMRHSDSEGPGSMKGMKKYDSSSTGNTLSPDMKSQVDKIFLEYLDRICSDLDAKDAKGEAIHQTLMPKKMARLAESTEFRPFKFRIQAFTNGLVEELHKNGYGEDILPVKKIKAYLWHQNPYIARFNDDGKKAKSKGNHIWNVEAKRISQSNEESCLHWIFKKFVRKIAGSPPSMAYIGLRWTFEPKIWDPQLSRANIHATFSSPKLPSWLSWNKHILAGVPGQDASDCEVTVEARFTQDLQEKTLSMTFPITVAPLAVGDTSFPRSRRPSLANTGEAANPRRFASDPVVTSLNTRPIPPQVTSVLPPPAATSAESAQVVQVLANAAHRVAQEAHTQAFNAPTPGPAQAQAQASLAKQQQVLAATAQAVGQDAGLIHHPNELATASSVLVAAGQQVVHQAARQVQADRTALAAMQQQMSNTPMPPLPPPPVSLNDVSVVTQSAVAHAVAITGPASSEVEVMMTANALIQQRSRAPSLHMKASSAMTSETSRPPAVSHVTHPVLPTNALSGHNVLAPVPTSPHSSQANFQY